MEANESAKPIGPQAESKLGAAGPGVAPARREWIAVEERGSNLGMKLLLGAVTLFGRSVGRALVAPIALFYVLVDRSLRRDSHAFLQRAEQDASFAAVYKHVLRFAQCALDRIFFLRGQKELFEITLDGHDTVLSLRERQVGAIFLGAHLGSFEAMRMASAASDVPLNVVMNNANAMRMRALIHTLDPNGSIRIIETADGGVELALRVREAIDRGELVAILGDRVTSGERSLRATFFGEPADFPVGPYLLASALGCPVFLTFGLYRGGNRYDLYCEPFAERIVLRRPREASLQAWVDRYAARLEHYCRLAPDNWFNFFDFWSGDDVSES